MKSGEKHFFHHFFCLKIVACKPKEFTVISRILKKSYLGNQDEDFCKTSDLSEVLIAS